MAGKLISAKNSAYRIKLEFFFSRRAQRKNLDLFSRKCQGLAKEPMWLQLYQQTRQNIVGCGLYRKGVHFSPPHQVHRGSLEPYGVIEFHLYSSSYDVSEIVWLPIFRDKLISFGDRGNVCLPHNSSIRVRDPAK